MRNNKEYAINLIELIDKKYLVEETTDNLIRVSFKRKGSGPNPKPFVIPSKIIIDNTFVEAIAMYIGDGKLSVDMHHLDFTSKDKDMIQFMLNFFLKRLNLHIQDIRYTITYRHFKEDMLFRWSSYLMIPKEMIHLIQSDRHREECLGMQISGMILRDIFGKIVQIVLTFDYSEQIELRHAFLRGLYAAEGGLGIVVKENYIAYISYHLSYQKEEKLSKFVQQLLEFEGITCKEILRPKKGERYIQITNWQNYWKLYRIGIFELNLRKKQKFLDKVQNTKFMFKVTDELRTRLLQFDCSFRSAFLRLNIEPTLMNNFKLKKTDYIDFLLLLTIAQHQNLTLNYLKQNIITTRVNRSTDLQDRDFVDFVFKNKSCS
ncbi:LAGLIDADG family homing endonuclease [Candidatus Woesearchaeota archaeon]|nr:LAGLIDADG family homing endonuclease [Candidatus Woesearchaeota archaeon]